MGLNDDSIACLRYLKERGQLGLAKRVVEIGAQQLSDRFLAARSQLDELGRLFGVDAPFRSVAPEPASLPAADAPLRPDAPFARDFYAWLGYEYACVDIDESPHSLPLDLNFDAVPARERGRYDLVTNFGTTEHVANQLNAFRIIHDLTALGGVMIHDVPTHGMLNHGLVNYNPKFFWMLARSNRYEWLLFNMNRIGAQYELPANIRDALAAYEHLGKSPDNGDHRTADAQLLVVFKKQVDMPFVPPLDVNTGARTDNETLARRYWTVFRPEAGVPEAASADEGDGASEAAADSRSGVDGASVRPLDAWELIEFVPMRFGPTLIALDEARIETRHACTNGRADQPLDEKLRTKIGRFIVDARACYRDIGLQNASAALDDLHRLASAPTAVREIAAGLDHVRATAEAELRTRRFLPLPPAGAR
jgi:hypothetical protein